jgi:fido (protein-threonine AMPylation protein)
MTGEERERRDSRALEPELITDPQAKAAAEARNGFRQYDAAIGTIQSALERGSFKLRPSLILGLQREALAGISSYAGNYRPGGVAIEGSRHEPVGAHLVPELIEDMCDYVNDHWDASTPLHLAAYLMWRLNWIHPFADGNGRTSRMVSYVALSIRAGAVLPGTPTIPIRLSIIAIHTSKRSMRPMLLIVTERSMCRRWKPSWLLCLRNNWRAFIRQQAGNCLNRLLLNFPCQSCFIPM